MQKLAPLNLHLKGVVAEALAAAQAGGKSPEGSRVRSHALSILKHAAEWYYLTLKIGALASKDRDVVGSAAVDYLMFAGYVTLAEHWLKAEVAADAALASGAANEDPAFYKAKIATANFVFEKLLPRTRAHAATMTLPSSVTGSLPQDQFSFDLV